MVYFSLILIKLLPLIIAAQYRKEEVTQRVTNYTWGPYSGEQVSEISESLLLVTNLKDVTGENGSMPKLLDSNMWNTRKSVSRFLVSFVARNSYQISEKHCRLLSDYICNIGMRYSHLKVIIEAIKVLITLIITQSNKLFSNNYWNYSSAAK